MWAVFCIFQWSLGTKCWCAQVAFVDVVIQYTRRFEHWCYRCTVWFSVAVEEVESQEVKVANGFKNIGIVSLHCPFFPCCLLVIYVLFSCHKSLSDSYFYFDACISKPNLHVLRASVNFIGKDLRWGMVEYIGGFSTVYTFPVLGASCSTLAWEEHILISYFLVAVMRWCVPDCF